jgi:hypothetical protein
MTKYKEAQIIKHALKMYVQRPDATEQEISEESRLLQKYSDRAEWLKEKYGIKEGLDAK